MQKKSHIHPSLLLTDICYEQQFYKRRGVFFCAFGHFISSGMYECNCDTQTRGFTLEIYMAIPADKHDIHRGQADNY
jgi:hypothetical protein